MINTQQHGCAGQTGRDAHDSQYIFITKIYFFCFQEFEYDIAIDTRSVTHSNIENKVHLTKLDSV